MSDMFLYLIKANISLALFYLGYYLWLRKLTFYGINRYYLVFALVFSALYPSIPIDKMFVISQDASTDLLPTFSDWQQIQLPAETTGTSNNISAAYWISVGLFGLLFLIKLMSIGRIHFRSIPARWDRFNYRKSNENISPFSFWTNIYFNPLLYTEDEYEKIFSHEQVHVRQLHSVDVLLAEISLIFFWYNPFCWMIRRAIQENIEFITDQRVLSSGIDKKSYQYSLVQLSSSSHPSYLRNHFNFKNLKKRIVMMNKKQSSILQLGKYVFIFPAIIVGSFIFGVSKAYDNSKTQQLLEVFPTDAQDTLKQKNSNRLNPTDNLDGAKQFIDNINKTYPTNIQPTPVNQTPRKTFQDTINTKKEPLYIVDGVKQTSKNRRNYTPQEVTSVNVLKDKAAIAAYGEEGKNGVIKVTTIKGTKDPLVQEASHPDNKFSVKFSTDSIKLTANLENYPEDKVPVVMQIQTDNMTSWEGDDENVLVFVDGKRIARSSLDQIDPYNIESLTVLKGDNAVKRHGEAGREGVIEIFTKGKNP